MRGTSVPIVAKVIIILDSLVFKKEDELIQFFVLFSGLSRPS